MERAFIVGVNLDGDSNFELSMDELASLAQACEMEVVGRAEQNMEYANTATYIGAGKVEEVRQAAEYLEADIVIFDNALSPVQLRNLQRELDKPVMDRTTLILEIFSTRAKTREAKLQVEVARLQYMLPRLVGLHDALSRQGGASGAMSNKGAGEKKLELDRRRLEQRLTNMKRELDLIAGERRTQRQKRARSGIPRVALVGYTNAGKSTIMNMLLGAYVKDEEKQVLEKDMLFATLDTQHRKISLEPGAEFSLIDTVGFVSKLPHSLVEAFKSTLDEVKYADLLIHVVDASYDERDFQIEVTDNVIKQLGAGSKEKIMVYNKMDIATEKPLDVSGSDVVYISAATGENMVQLIKKIKERIFAARIHARLLIPYDKGSITSYLCENAEIISTEYTAEGTLIEGYFSVEDYGRYEKYGAV